MAEVILMPRLSDTMTEGVIAEWHKNVGDTVKKGDVLADIETDKATMELESYQNGTLLHIGTIKGGKLQVNDLLAIIGNKGEDISELIKVKGTAEVDTVKETPKVDNSNVTSKNVSLDISAMEEVVLMPRLSDTMTEGVIASWVKSVGDSVKKGDVLAEIETDKATMELESYKDGVLLYQGAQAGEKIQVNDLLCIIGKADLNIEPIIAASKNGSATSATNETAQPNQTVASSAKETTSPTPTIQEVVVNTGRIFVSPLAKKLAEEKGIDLKYVKGSGDNGRIVKADIDSYKGEKVSASVSQDSTITNQPFNPSTNSYTDVPVSQMRKVIAKRLSESLFTAPHFYLTMSVDMDEAVNARKKLNEDADVKISFNDMVIKATAMALRKHPKVNSSWLGDVIRQNNHINIGVAVAVEEGLLVPVVKHADHLSFSQIGTQVKDYAQKAKDKKLQPNDWEGNTFTISNLGMFGIEEFTAIINPPDSCILAVGGISQVPVVKNGNIVIGNVMKLTLSCDHRVVDGATGASFLQTLKSYLEQPLKMLA
ncbi:MAG: pyruvate dehydrogenase complex dihydrolipoamide acetyltransferase [Chitinophagaceae bacterium]|nr:pyruvate dehydrogenase complex dihydrolipoamide acetyltransferase [Chitinophagaceae bacterium]